MAEHRPPALRALGALLALTSALLLTLILLDRALPPPLTAPGGYATEVVDRHGERLRLYPNERGFWRLPATPEQVDSRFIELLLAYEDHRFRRHGGVDPLALIRALGQFLRQGRIISGGSTLTMQTVRLLQPRPRTLGSKLVEMLRAWQLERRLDKQQILALYLDLAPYGGNLQGVRAASLFYFGKEPGFLTLAEAALLVALPQSPERRRPDRFPAEARRARERVLARLEKAGAISRKAAAQARRVPVPTRRLPTPWLAPHLSDRLHLSLPQQRLIRTTLDASLQRRLERLLARHQRRLPAGVTLAALILENGNSAVRAYAGSGDWSARGFPGQVDMVRALRSPGSSLKPFIYGLGFDAGFIHPETLIADRPGPIKGYSPGNFDHGYRGEIPVREALRSSRNLPAVKVLDRLGPLRFTRTLERAGIRLHLPDGQRPSLPIALGGVGIRLQALVRLYAALANHGRTRPLQLLMPLQKTESLPLLSPTAAWYLTDILADSPLPDGFVQGERRLAFKTGTSYGFRDAWAIGFDADHSIAIWIGRPDGGYTPGLYGLQTAVPVMMESFDLLPQAGLGLLLRQHPSDLLLTGNTGLPEALQRFDTPAVPRTTLAGADRAPRILYPPPDSRVELVDQEQPLILVEGRGGTLPYHWLVNDQPLPDAERRRLEWRPERPGPNRITLIDHDGHSTRIQVEVVMP